jgi:tRNA modification GTPase
LAAIESIEASNWPQAAQTLDVLLAHRDVGLHLTTPWQVVLTGPPNVGKSSLINALMGFQRAIVSPTPGTTRDVVTATTAIDGWPVQLADTAGLRETRDELEAAGVELARVALSKADLVIVVQEAMNSTAEFDSQLLPLSKRAIQVRSKVDLLGDASGKDVDAEPPRVPNHSPRAQVINTSTVTREGISELIATIGASIVPNPPAPGEAVPFTLSQIESLVVARNAIRRRDSASATDALRSLLAR